MNTCAECRFWKETAEVNVPSSREGQWNQCWREGEDDSRAQIDDMGTRAYSVGLMTRSDFGCVQFTPRDIPLTEIKRMYDEWKT